MQCLGSDEGVIWKGGLVKGSVVFKILEILLPQGPVAVHAPFKFGGIYLPEKYTYVRRPTMEPFFVKKLLRFRGFFPWNFGVPRHFSSNLT